jgi:hypothetical protein
MMFVKPTFNQLTLEIFLEYLHQEGPPSKEGFKPGLSRIFCNITTFNQSIPFQLGVQDLYNFVM